MYVHVCCCPFILDQLSGPMNVRSIPLPNNLTSVMLEWDTFSQTTCSRDTVSYTIAINGVAVSPVLSDTSYIVTCLEANRMYTASVSMVASNCMSGQSNITFEIMAESELLPLVCKLCRQCLIIVIAPMPVVDTHFFCANSSDSITLMTHGASGPQPVMSPSPTPDPKRIKVPP